MKWFFVVMALADGNTPYFFATETPSFEVCTATVAAAKLDVANAGEHGNAVAIYCATGTPDKSSWNYNGNLWFAEPKSAADANK